MIHLTEIKVTKRSYQDIESSMLCIGLFKGKKLNPQHKILDMAIDNQLSHAIQLDDFQGEIDSQISLYGNKSIKRIFLIGLCDQKKYTTDVARSIASKLTRYADGLKVASFTVGGDSFNLKNNTFAQAFSEGLILGSYRFNDYKTKEDVATYSSSVTIC